MQSIMHQRVGVIMYLIIIFMFVWMLALSFGVAFMLHNRGDTFCSIRAPHATSVFQTPRPISFHSNCIQSQPLFLLINTGVSLNLRRRTRIHLDGCISWGDPGGSHDVTDEERWWGNSCWSDSLDFSLNSAITPKLAQIIIPSSSFSPITLFTSREKESDGILSCYDQRL